MTKEPIIIHDVDVSECEYHSFNKFGNSLCDLENNPIARSQSRMCEQNPICPYKVRYDLIQKLKHKEQEREELLTKIDIQKRENIIFTLEARKLVAQYSSKLDQLKTEKKKLKNKIKKLLHDCNSCNFHKYKQALQEIKNFIYIEKAKVFVDMEDFWEQILQKCEVLDE